AIERLAAALELDGVIAPGTDWPVAVAARVAEKLGLPHPIAPATAVLATNKLRQRERLAEAGIPQPRWQLVTGEETDLVPPCVVKAPDRQGQKGLSLVLDPEELPAALAVARRHRPRRGARRRARGDGERLLGRGRVRPADGHRPADGGAAGVRRRARARLAGAGRPSTRAGGSGEPGASPD